MNRRTGALLLLAALFGCGSTDGLPDADALPYRLTLVQDVHQAIAGDLDADGEDELIYWYAPGQMLPGSFMAVVLARHTGEVVEQVNFDGHVRGVLLRDLDGDGRPEILVQLIRNDSLFLSVLGQRGEKLRTFFVTSGRARVEPEGTIPWDPNIVNAFVTDVDGVDGDELVLLVFTGYARLPRGVFVHALPDGRRLGEAIVGAGPIDGILGDFDDDSRPELVVAAIARNNGADAGGFDDSKGHLLLFTLSPTPNVERSLDLPAGFGIARIAYDDFDRDGRAELLAIGGAITGLGGSGEFWMLEPNTWEVLRTRKFDQPLTSPVVLDLDRDTRPEIVALHAGREVRVFDHTFSAIHRRALPGAPDRLTTAPDFDGDGIDELVVHYGMNRSVMLGSDLAPMATWDGGIVVAVVRRGIGNVPLLIVKGPSVDFLARMDANPMYLLHRYGPVAAAVLTALISALVMLTLIRLDRENRRLRTAHAAAPNSASSACLVDRRGRVRWTSPALRVRLPPRGGRRGHGAPHLDVLDHVAPGIAAAVRSRIGDRNTGQARAGHGMTGPGGVTIESVLVGDRGDPHLLIRIGEPRQSTMEVAPRTWALMAQRVAHALKNPLTSMLLTLRRLEMEYREHAPAAASRLDRYSGRLEERIEELRRLTSNFLKFVDVELPRLESIDANAIVREYGALIERTRPPDIRLDVRLGPHLPRIQADEDQLLAALENLVANAVDAMPDGGLITLSTQLSRGMRWTGDEGARDYVTIEVADTGTGIAEDIKPRLFEPGWSGRQDGSGLGLAIVRKVMRDHGGQITFESEVGSGSAFTMFLPTVGVIDGGASGEPARFGRSMEEHVAQS